MSTSAVGYPPPPWHTHGNGAGAGYVVPAATIALPQGFKPMTLLGRTMGVLSYIEYLPPSPLSYRELIWMPAMVRWHRGGRGYWVQKMYVDDEASLAAGRELWALPKSLARFERDGDRVHMTAEDGTVMRLRMSGRGPRKRISSKVTTLQHRSGRAVRFGCSFLGDVQLGRLDVEHFDAGDDSWLSFERARRAPASAGLLHGFETTMHAPTMGPTR